LKGAALHRFLMRKHGRRWDDAPTPGFDVNECSQTALKLFRTKAAKSGRVTEEVLENSDEVLLENLQLTEGQYLRRAAALLFGASNILEKHGTRTRTAEKCRAEK
jgi:ATP-dependent DNA helicase RecG